ncbi:MAG: glutamate 5-kinase [Clostridiaceae bacterium]|nr:glutamate 5-kinase [Clostridiaceae bacterium]
MKKAGELIREAHKIVIKIGSSSLTNRHGLADRQMMRSLVEQIVSLIEANKQIIIVSSGAASSGVATINKWHRKNDVHYKQALCAIGQVELMSAYRDIFWDSSIHVAQLLITREDILTPKRRLYIRNTLFTLLDEGVVPIVNENDSVSVEEIEIGDNDNLSAMTADLWSADLLILLSDVDGLYTKDPHTNPDAELIACVQDIEACRDMADICSKGYLGTGGMETKLEAAELANKNGIPVILTNSNTDNVFSKLINDELQATVFLPQDKLSRSNI